MNKTVAILLLIALSAFSAVLYFSRPKLGYVNLKEVFEQFSYTKKLRGELKMIQEARLKKLDSFNFELKVLSEKLKTSRSNDLAAVFEVKRNEYIMLEREMVENNNSLTQSYDDKIHTQLQAFLKDFGKEDGYDYLYGTEALGTILYARDRYNVTADAIEYINKRFSATNK